MKTCERIHLPVSFFRKACVLFSTAALSAAVLFSGCGRIDTGEDEVAERQGTYFDTIVDIRIYGENADDLLDQCFDLCADMEDTFSAQKEGSELYQVNHRTSDTVTVSEDLASCLSTALSFCELTDGVFDITIYPVSSLWNFDSEDPQVPSAEKIEEELKKVDYRKVHLDGTTLKFDSPGTMIDLGAVAKGYISGKMKEMLEEEGCESAVINLGGNVRVIGSKPDGSDWNVGLQKPFAEEGTVLTSVKVSDSCVISSGIYERYFEADGKRYHHILDSSTGYPVETDLNMVSVVGTDDAACDALSTIGILLGKEKFEAFVTEHCPDVQVLFTDTDNQYEWFRPGAEK